MPLSFIKISNLTRNGGYPNKNSDLSAPCQIYNIAFFGIKIAAIIISIYFMF